MVLPALLLFPLLVPVALSASPAGELSEKDQKAIAKDLAAYFSAREKGGQGATGAMASLTETLDKLEKKAKGRSPLAMLEDLGQAFWYAQEYDQQKGIRKGRIDVSEVELLPTWKFQYALHAPKKYDPRRTQYPVIVSIPDRGRSAQQHLTEDWVDSWLRDEVILVAVDMPQDPSRWTDRSQGGGGGHILGALREVRAQYAVDFDRIFLAGQGAGVAAAVEIAASSQDTFAGVIGRSGDPAAEVAFENFSNLPTFFAGAGANATAFQDNLKQAGYENCTLASSAGEAEIAAWLQQQRRVANPPTVLLRTGTPYSNKAYWIRTPATSGAGSLIKAKADRESNTITVDAVGVTSVTLYFNDALVDMDKPVKVVCNGAVSTDLIPRNVGRLLELYWNGTCDPGRLYTAERVYDMPVAQSQ